MTATEEEIIEEVALRVGARITDYEDMFGAGLQRRLQKLVAAEKAARLSAARVATQVTSSSFHRKRVVAPPRNTRSGTGQGFSQLRWRVLQSGNGVAFDIAAADRDARHWFIQEIGTGQRAVLRKGGATLPMGRPKNSATYSRSVKSQVGRRISNRFVFATEGRYSPPGSSQGEALVRVSSVTGAPGRRAGIRIGKEIEGQHFVREGGEIGFLEYRTQVFAAARQAFSKATRP